MQSTSPARSSPRREPAAALHQNASKAARGQRFQRSRERRAAVRCRCHLDDLHALLAPDRVAPVAAECGRRDDPGRMLARIPNERVARRQPRAAVDHDTHRALAAEPWKPAGQRRVVGERARSSHRHGVVLGPEQMPAGPRRRAGDPAAVSAARPDPPVERARELERHVGPAPLDARQEARVERARLILHAAARDLNARFFEHGVAAARDAGIRVLRCDDGAGDPGLDQRVGAGAGLAVMGAGLQGGVAGGASRAVAGAGERLGLGVGPAAGLGPAPPDDVSLVDEHAAHRRVGPHVAEAPASQRQRQRHEATVEGRVGLRHAFNPARRRGRR